MSAAVIATRKTVSADAGRDAMLAARTAKTVSAPRILILTMGYLSRSERCPVGRPGGHWARAVPNALAARGRLPSTLPRSDQVIDVDFNFSSLKHRTT